MRCYPVGSAVNSCEGTPVAGGVARRLRQAAAVGLIGIFAVGCAVSNRIALPPLPQVDVLVLLQASLGPGGAGQAYPAQTISTNLTVVSSAILSACGFVSPPGTAPGNNVVPRGLQITVGTPPGGATNTGCTISGMIDAAVTPGTYTFTVRAADNNAPPQTDDETYSMVISSLAFTLGPNPAATVTGETFSVTWSFTVVGSPANPNQGVLVELVNAANVVEDSCTAGVGAGGCGGLASPAVGNKTIRLTYPAPGQVDPNFPAGGGTSRAHTVTAASTTTTITADAPDPSVTGQQYTVNVTVAPVAPGAGAPTGSVSVSDGLGNNCVAALTPGANQSTGSCLLNGPTAGARTLTASYAGDANYSASVGTNPHTVNPAPTTTTITSDVADPSVVGQAYTVNVTIDVNAPGAGTPTGVVAINDGQGVMCNATLAAGPAANQASGTCSLTSVTTAANLLTASYPGDANFAASVDTEAHVVSTASTTTAITSDLPDPSVSGESYLVNFTVTSVAPGMGEPTGNVTADDGAGQSCVGALTPGAPGTNTSTGSCSLQSASASGPGPAKTVTATYGGDANFSGSIGTTGHTVNPANTTTVVVSSSAVVGGIRMSEFQEAVTFTATVTITAPGSATPIGLTGIVDFVDITTSTNLCTGVTVTAGMASCMVSNLAVGIHSVEARYDAANTDLNFNSSTGTERQQVVPAATQTAIASSSNPSEFQETVTFTATITVPGPGSGSPIAPSGTVTFLDGALPITGCASQALSAGQATCITATLTVGGHNITAIYNGDANFAPSGSPILPQTVNPATTLTAVVSSPASSDFQQPVTFTATVTVPGPGTAAPIPPGGTVQFFDGGVGIPGCSAPTPAVLNAAGQATCVVPNVSAPALSVGAHNITANYSGDGNFAASTSPIHMHTVNQASTTTTIDNAAALMANPTVVGEPYAVNVTVSVNPPGGGVPTGTVTVNDGTGGMCTTGALLGGSGSCLITSTSVGTPKTLTATYGGDGNYTGSTSAGVSHAVNQATTAIAIIAPPPAPTVVGEAYTVGFLVIVNAPGAGTPTGIVTVSDGSQTCVATLPTASCLLTSTTAGLKTLTASYAGDANFAASNSSGVLHIVDPAITVTTITADAPDPSAPLGNYTVSVRVDTSAPGTGSATGTVTVSDNDATPMMCMAALAPGPGPNQSSGSCILASNPAVTPTTLNLTANYPGDGNFSASLSAVEPHTVDVVTITAIALGDGVEGRAIGAGTGPDTILGNADDADGVRFPISGGLAPYTCALTAGGTLPGGVTVNPTAVLMSDGVTRACELTGTPAGGSAGTYAVDVTVTDANATSDTTGPIAWDINLPLAITDAAGLPDAVEDRNYAFTFDTTTIGGSGPYTWSESGASLGLLDCLGFSIAANGDLSGAPPLVAGGGTCGFTSQVMDTATTTTAAGTATKAHTILVQPALTIPAQTAPNALRNNTYFPFNGADPDGFLIQAVGGTGTPYNVNVPAGDFTLVGPDWIGDAATACEGLTIGGLTIVDSSGFIRVRVSGAPVNAGLCGVAGAGTVQIEVADTGNSSTASCSATASCPTFDFNVRALDNFLYVADPANDQINVILVDTTGGAADAEITTAPPPIGAVSDPHSIAITPDGTKAFVTLQTTDSFLVIDTVTNTVLAGPTLFTNCTDPRGIDIGKAGAALNIAFVGCGNDIVATIDTTTNTEGAEIALAAGAAAHYVAITPDGNTVFVSRNSQIGVSINATTLAVTEVTVADGGGTLRGVVVSADGLRVYFADAANDEIQVRSAADLNTQIDCVPGGVPNECDMGANSAPEGITLSLDGLFVFVALNGTGEFGVINEGVAPTVNATAAIGTGTFGVTTAPGTNRVYFTLNGADAVARRNDTTPFLSAGADVTLSGGVASTPQGTRAIHVPR